MMKNLKISLALIPVLLALPHDSLKAGQDPTGERVVLEAGVTHEGWYFASGKTVIIDGTVNGDAYLAGVNVDVNGVINGDLIVAGGNVTVNGTVSDDIRIAGGNVALKGSVGKDVTAAGGNILIGGDGKISGNLLSAGGNLNIDGLVAKEVKAAGGRMVVNGSVGGDVGFAGGNISVLSGAAIGGDLEAMIEKKEDAEIAGGTVRGTVTLTGEGSKEVCNDIVGFSPHHFWFKIIWCASLLFTGLIVTFVLPKQLNRAGTNILDRPGETALWGIIGLIAAPVASFILFMTIVGIPLALWLVALFFWWLYLSQLALGVAVGQRVLGSRDGNGWRLFSTVAAGILIVQALTFVPYLRYLVVIVTVLFGVGAVLRVAHEEYMARR